VARPRDAAQSPKRCTRGPWGIDEQLSASAWVDLPLIADRVVGSTPSPHTNARLALTGYADLLPAMLSIPEKLGPMLWVMTTSDTPVSYSRARLAEEFSGPTNAIRREWGLRRLLRLISSDRN
jgi:CRISPR/Cas system-associated exonuclease Cas4 (RecB family)